MNLNNYHENKQRGSFDYPLDYHYVTKEHSRYEMPYHWHSETEIIHVLSGILNLYVGDELYTLNENDYAYVASGLLHGGVPENCVYECIVFDMRLLLKTVEPCKQYISDIYNGDIVINTLFVQTNSPSNIALNYVFNSSRSATKGYQLQTIGGLYIFIAQVLNTNEYAKRKNVVKSENIRAHKLKKVFEVIETEFRNPPTLTQLASLVGMSPKYFCKFFKDTTHRTPMDYIMFYRIEMSCYAFIATNKNVTEIALDMGFSDVNYFIRCFKKYKGVTPGKYRNTFAKAEN